MRAPKLGRWQQMALKSMSERNGSWYPGCGWIIDTTKGTTKIMESLVKHGYVKGTEREVVGGRWLAPVAKGYVRTTYTITEAGRRALEASQARYQVRVRGSKGYGYKVIDTTTGEVVRSSTAREGAQNQADALNAKAERQAVESR